MAGNNTELFLDQDNVLTGNDSNQDSDNNSDLIEDSQSIHPVDMSNFDENLPNNETFNRGDISLVLESGRNSSNNLGNAKPSDSEENDADRVLSTNQSTTPVEEISDINTAGDTDFLLEGADNSSPKGRSPATGSQDPEIQLDTLQDVTKTDRSGSHEQVEERRKLNCQQPLIPMTTSENLEEQNSLTKPQTLERSFSNGFYYSDSGVGSKPVSEFGSNPTALINRTPPTIQHAVLQSDWFKNFFTNWKFQVALFILLAASALVITSLALPHASLLIAAPLLLGIHLSTLAFNAILGTSIAVAAVSTVSLGTSIYCTYGGKPTADGQSVGGIELTAKI